jgi:hypothetical protein
VKKFSGRMEGPEGKPDSNLKGFSSWLSQDTTAGGKKGLQRVGAIANINDLFNDWVTQDKWPDQESRCSNQNDEMSEPQEQQQQQPSHPNPLASLLCCSGAARLATSRVVNRSRPQSIHFLN